MQDQTKQNRLITVLTLVALVAMISAFFAPIWWVSLTAPNYPKDAFPDGIRIHFHFDVVKNGCSAVGASTRMGSETMQADMGPESERYNPILDAKKDVNKDAAGLDCVHEMNTINHYVGMFPIATGAPVEKPLAKFFFGFFAVMLLGFITPEGKRRLLVLGKRVFGGCRLDAGTPIRTGPPGGTRQKLYGRGSHLFQRTCTHQSMG
jgi:hypothetical protein